MCLEAQATCPLLPVVLVVLWLPVCLIPLWLWTGMLHWHGNNHAPILTTAVSVHRLVVLVGRGREWWEIVWPSEVVWVEMRPHILAQPLAPLPLHPNDYMWWIDLVLAWG